MTADEMINDIPMKEEDGEKLPDAPPAIENGTDEKNEGDKPTAANTDVKLDDLFNDDDDDDDDEFPASSAVDSIIPSSPPAAIPP